MLLGDIKLPDMNLDSGSTKEKLQKMYEYMQQLNNQIRYALSHIGRDNMSPDLLKTLDDVQDAVKSRTSLVEDEAFQTFRKQTAREMSAKANAKVTDDDGNETDLWTKVLQTAQELLAVVGGDTPVGSVNNTTVIINRDGVAIATGGTFTVASGNFSLDEEGNLTANGAQINGKLLNDGKPVLTNADIYVGTTEPLSKTPGMVWIKPGMAEEEPTVSQTVHSGVYAIDVRRGLKSYPISGTLTGSPAPAAGAMYEYTFEIPVYIYGAVNGGTVSIRIGSKTFTGTVSGNKYNHKTVVITGTHTEWFGNQEGINYTIYASTDAINNERNFGGYEIRMTSRSY
jgi:hypothetical protein